MGTEPKHLRAKRWAVFLTGLMLCTSVRSDEAGYRTFSDTQGRTFKGKLMDYEAASKTAAFKLSAGKKGRMPLTMFSDADRLFILDWEASRRFHEGLEVKPTPSFSVVSEKESGINDITKKVFDSFYEIRLINKTDVRCEKINIEYCIFYNQGERKNRTVRYEEGVCYGKDVVELIDPSSEQACKTKSVRLYTEGGNIGLFGSENVALANVQGIWLRLTMKLPSGSEIVREYRTSDEEHWKWAPYSFGAGLNEGAHVQTYYFIK